MRELWLEIWRARLMDDCVRSMGNDACAAAVQQTFDWFCERLGITEFENPPSISELGRYVIDCGYHPEDLNWEELS